MTGTRTAGESFQFGLWHCSTDQQADSGPITGINLVVTSGIVTVTVTVTTSFGKPQRRTISPRVPVLSFS